MPLARRLDKTECRGRRSAFLRARCATAAHRRARAVSTRSPPAPCHLTRSVVAELIAIAQKRSDSVPRMSPDAARRGLTSQMAAILFVTAAALLFQVAQTRLFSAAFGYHLTYLVISVALLGVGWGATLSAVIDARPRRPSLGQLAMAVAASIVLALLVETHVDPIANLGLAVGAAYLLGFPPFAFA